MKRITLTIEELDTLLIDDSRFKNTISFTLTDEKFNTICDSLGALEEASKILSDLAEEMNL